jgi:UDPglucose 6-dehydrogenase
MDSGAKSMKVGVAGLWHLGCVTAACVAQGGHDVIAYDPTEETISKLQSGTPPIFEPGLKELIAENVAHKRLQFSASPAALSAAEIVWVTFDTPVNDEDGADVEFVLREVEKILPHLQHNAFVIISSQIPVGTTHKIQALCLQLCPQKNISFACLPENLRLGASIRIFMQPDRIVVGLDDQKQKNKIE